MERMVLHTVPLALRSNRVRGFMGYPPEAVVAPRILERIDEEMAACSSHLHPRAMYAVLETKELSSRSVELEGGIVFRGAIGEFLGEVERVAVFLATAGDPIYERSQQAMRAGRPLEGLVANAVGSEAVECAVEFVEERIREEAAAEGREITMRYSPGYCGMDIREQEQVFAALDGSQIGVSLLPSFIMTPIKSVSGIIGIGASERIVRKESPCAHCDRGDCMMRRYA